MPIVRDLSGLYPEHEPSTLHNLSLSSLHSGFDSETCTEESYEPEWIPPSLKGFRFTKYKRISKSIVSSSS